MTAERWRQIEELFARLVDLPVGEREAVLAEASEEVRAEVMALLDSDAAAGEAIAERVGGGVQNWSGAAPVITHAGPYLLRSELGRGGMGTVYLGQRSDGQYTGEVAVKLLRPGMDTGIFLERFKRERQALARMQHPNIARLLDSGAAEDGSPYIVMELVHGQQIHDYCKERGLGAAEILALFLPVCRAVAYAHQQLIVHRDLKPGNILVTADGVPKLLDFGICKTLDETDRSNTATAAHMLTPEFASPEQVRGDAITPASDIYALGAVLYSLLTGRSPHVLEKYAAMDLVQAICEAEAVRPGVSADIDTIVLKALQKDPARRYASAEQLAEDLRRVLANEPVLARPDTAAYRTKKFLRRHPVGVAATVAVALAMGVGLAAYVRQAAIARRQSVEARRMANAMIFNIHDKLRHVSGSLEARQEIVRLGLDYLDRMSAESAGDAALRRELAGAYLRIGDAQGNLLTSHTGDVSGALVSYRKGLAALEGLPDTPEQRETWFTLVDHSVMILNTRDPAEAIRQYQQAVKLAREVAEREPGSREAQYHLAKTYNQFALLLRPVEPAKALENYTEAAKRMRALLAQYPGDFDLHSSLASTLSGLGVVQSFLKQHDAAGESLRESIQHGERFYAHAPNNSRALRALMLAYGHLGDALTAARQGQPGEAYGQMIRIAEEAHAKNPGDQTASFDLGMALAKAASSTDLPAKERLGLYARAEGFLGEAAKRDAENLSIRVNMASNGEAVGDLQMEAGNAAGARAAYEQVVRTMEPGVLKAPVGRRVAVTVRRKLALLVLGGGDAGRAKGLAQEGVRIVGEFEGKEKTAADRLIRFLAYSGMGQVLQAARVDGAREWMEKALAGYGPLQGDPAFRGLYKEDLRRLEGLAKK